MRSRASLLGGRDWLAGDHHIHSEFSVGHDSSTHPPTPIVAGDGIYPIARNAAQAQRYGLAWMVSTDHGGPNHSNLMHGQAYPSLVESRRAVPGVLQFYGMEFDTPAADHSTLIVPKVAAERDVLFQLESGYSRLDAWPTDPARDTAPKMLAALREMRAMADRPVLFANHPARSATGLGLYGEVTPREFRAWNDLAPEISVGFEGAPGHQAGGVNRDGTLDPPGARGGYGRYPTMGGYDQMTARLGGLWDALLGEGRRWWITGTSDSHVHYTDGGPDFWPGEYVKTYVHAAKDYADILDGLRSGRMFVTTGDLIDRLQLTVRRTTPGGGQPQGPNTSAMVGENLTLRGRADRGVTVEARFRVPSAPNAHGDRPRVRRVDVIAGMVTGLSLSPDSDTNPTTRVLVRHDDSTWRRDGEWIVVTHEIPEVEESMYVRVRGTSTEELEPEPDRRGDDPWQDLWFYSNPLFITR